MFRSILGFAVLAILAWLGLKLIFGILGSLVGLAMTVLWLAFIGFVVYLALRLRRPPPPGRPRGTIKGRPPPPNPFFIPGKTPPPNIRERDLGWPPRLNPPPPPHRGPPPAIPP